MRGVPRDKAETGLRPRGEPGQWWSQRKHCRMLEPQRPSKGNPGDGAPHVCWAPMARQPMLRAFFYYYYFLISKLNGYPSSPVREVALTSLSLSFLNCKMNSNEWSRSHKTRVCAAWPATGAVRGHWTPAGEGQEQRTASATAVRTPPPFTASEKMEAFKGWEELWNYCFNICSRRWQRNHNMHIWLQHVFSSVIFVWFMPMEANLWLDARVI